MSVVASLLAAAYASPAPLHVELSVDTKASTSPSTHDLIAEVEMGIGLADQACKAWSIHHDPAPPVSIFLCLSCATSCCYSSNLPP